MTENALDYTYLRKLCHGDFGKHIIADETHLHRALFVDCIGSQHPSIDDGEVRIVFRPHFVLDVVVETLILHAQVGEPNLYIDTKAANVLLQLLRLLVGIFADVLGQRLDWSKFVNNLHPLGN